MNISVVNGVLPPGAVAEMRARGKQSIPTGKDLPFFACGISSVIHPVINTNKYINFTLTLYIHATLEIKKKTSAIRMFQRFTLTTDISRSK